MKKASAFGILVGVVGLIAAGCVLAAQPVPAPVPVTPAASAPATPAPAPTPVPPAPAATPTPRPISGVNLLPVAPQGWESPLIVSSIPGARQSGPVAVGGPVYISFSVGNRGSNATPSNFFSDILVDGVVVHRVRYNPLEPRFFATVTDWADLPATVRIAPGKHRLRLVVDPTNLVAENDKADNVLEREVEWAPPAAPPSVTPTVIRKPNLVPFQLKGWDGVIVAASAQESISSASARSGPLSVDATPYISYGLKNVGPTSIGVPFWVYTYLDGVLVDRAKWDGLPSDTITWRAPISTLGQTVPLAPGPHTLRVEVDATHLIDESNEDDNVFEQPFLWGVGPVPTPTPAPPTPTPTATPVPPTPTPMPGVIHTPLPTRSAPTGLPATVVGRLTGLPSFRGAASLRIATIRATRPETGEVATTILLKEPFGYQVKVPPGLYLLIARVVDLQSRKAYLGFSRVFRVKVDDTRQLDLLMEPSVVTRQPAPPIGPSLVKSPRLSMASPLALLPRGALAAPLVASEGASDLQISTQVKPVVIGIGDFTLTQGPGVQDKINHDLGASDVAITELFGALVDEYVFVDTSSAVQKGIQQELKRQQAGLIDPDTKFEYRPLTPDYEIKGKVHVDGVYETGAGDLSLTLELVDTKTGQVLVTRTASGKQTNIRDFFALTVNDFESKLVVAIKQQVKVPPTSVDLTVLPVTFSPSSAKPGDRISVSFTVKNQGGSPSGSFSNRISLATTKWGTNISLGNSSIGGLAAGASQPSTVSVTIPTSVSQGSYWVTVYTDGLQVISEGDENNNIGSSDPNKLSILVPVSTPGLALRQLTCIGKTGFQVAPGGGLVNCDDPGNKTSAFDFR